jgi:acetylornithine deacetylase/succinyl-diaminopimelate desuccinylase-like protein
VRLVADGAMFYGAGIPTVYHGPMGTGAHGDVETIGVPELVRATEVYLAMLERLWA